MAKKNSAPPSGDVKLDAIYLHRVQLERLGAWPEGQEELDVSIKWGIGAVLLANGQLGVELGVKVEHEDMVALEVAYRMELSAAAEIPAKPGVEAFWRNAAARVAPIIAVPYIRETVHSLTGRALNESVLLPIANYGAYFKPEVIPLTFEIEAEVAAE